MIFNRVFTDGQWIANGYFFKRCQEIVRKEFADKFLKLAEKASEVGLIGLNIVKLADLDCILFGNSEGCCLVQNQYLQELGFDIHEPDEFEFKVNREANMLFVYNVDGDLLGGVMLVVLQDMPIEDELLELA